MTDKQIIIDGVDVAGCEYLGLYKECKLKCGSCCPVDCSDNPNCYYKLYKRKEQECEKWKSYYKLYRIETDIVKKVQGVINSNPKYGIEFTEDDIICKDERISYLEVHEQVKLIIDEQAKELDQLKRDNEELKRELQAQRDFTAHEQKLIYCVAYDETCKTDNDCKQEKCIFKDNIKLKKLLQRQKRLQKI